MTLPEQTGHAAVAAAYAHVTAPLRRLVDRFGLVVCEALCRGAEVPAWARESLASLPEVMARSDRSPPRSTGPAPTPSRSASLQHLVGETFRAVVVDARKDGGLIQIAEPAILAPLTGAAPAGSEVTARLVEADLARRVLRFELVSVDVSGATERLTAHHCPSQRFTRDHRSVERTDHECHRRPRDQRPRLRRAASTGATCRCRRRCTWRSSPAWTPG